MKILSGRVLSSDYPVGWLWFEIMPDRFALGKSWEDVKDTFEDMVDNREFIGISLSGLNKRFNSLRDITDEYQEPEYVYRVIFDDGRTTGGPGHGRQHTYKKEHTARTVATQQGGMVQRSLVTWKNV